MSDVIEIRDEENFTNDVLNSELPVLVDFWAGVDLVSNYLLP